MAFSKTLKVDQSGFFARDEILDLKFWCGSKCLSSFVPSKWIKTIISLNFICIVYTLFRAAQIGQPNAKEFMPTIDMMKLPASTDIMSVLGDEKMAQEILKRRNQVVR